MKDMNCHANVMISANLSGSHDINSTWTCFKNKTGHLLTISYILSRFHSGVLVVFQMSLVFFDA